MEWNNIKFSSLPYPNDPPYLYHRDLRKPLPYQDNSFDALYCNHVFEHLTPADGFNLANELYRVLKSDGICRVVVPDLEAAAREYLDCLNKVTFKISPGNITQYEWGVADLIDQMVRLKLGGMMAENLTSGNVDWEQIKRRNGDVFDNLQFGQEKKITKGFKIQLQKLLPKSVKDIPRLANKVWYRLLREVYFRLSKKSRVELYNEKNLWMYDRFSLPRLLEKSGFRDIQVVDFNISQIESWSRYNFDQSERGNYPLEPSVYVEGEK
ncbi:MAG: methyltransferase domain-containing protein [Anaerolineales bacterium]